MISIFPSFSIILHLITFILTIFSGETPNFQMISRQERRFARKVVLFLASASADAQEEKFWKHKAGCKWGGRWVFTNNMGVSPLVKVGGE